MNKKEKKQILEQLSSFSGPTIMPLLPTIKESGDVDFIVPLADVLLHSSDEMLTKQVKNIFLDLKTNTVVPEIVKLISNPVYKSLNAFFRALAWELQLDFSDYFSTFIDLFIAAAAFDEAFDYFTTIEVILKNRPGKVSLSQIDNAVSSIKFALHDFEETKKSLAVECIHLLETHKKIINELPK